VHQFQEPSGSESYYVHYGKNPPDCFYVYLIASEL
jgi:hypothetical protein